MNAPVDRRQRLIVAEDAATGETRKASRFSRAQSAFSTRRRHNVAMLEPATGHRRYALAVFALALLIRFFISIPDACISRDGVWFIEMVAKLQDDPVRHMRIETKQPGFSWILLAIGSVTGHTNPETIPTDWQPLGVWVAMIFGSFVCVLIYQLTRQLFDAQTAMVAGVFAAFWPDGGHLSADVLSDMPHLAFYLGVILAVWRACQSTTSTKTLMLLSLAGLMAGLAYWIRLEAIGLAPAVCLWLLFEKNAAIKTRLVRTVAFGFAFIIPFAAFAVASGRLLFVKTPAIALLDPPNLMLAHMFPLWQLPGRILEAWGKSGRYVFAPMFLLCLFLRGAPKGLPSLRKLFMWIAAWHLLLIAARVGRYGELSSRYLIIPAALTIPWAAAGFRYLIQLIAASVGAKTVGRFRFVFGIGLIVALTPLAIYLARPINASRGPFREAGLWLGVHSAETDIIFAASDEFTQTQYYADRTYPNNDLWEIVDRDSASMAHQREPILTFWFIESCDKEDEVSDDVTSTTQASGKSKEKSSELSGFSRIKTFENEKNCIRIWKSR